MEKIKLLIFDFDGVLAESKSVENLKLSDFANHKSVLSLIAENKSQGEIEKHVSDLMFEHTKSSYMVYMWLGRILPKLAKIVKLAICTDNCMKNIKYSLGDLLSYFTIVKTCHDVSFLKPHPQGLSDIIREAGINDNAGVVFIGDTMANIEAATAVGIKVVVAGWGHDPFFSQNVESFPIPELLLDLVTKSNR